MSSIEVNNNSWKVVGDSDSSKVSDIEGILVDCADVAFASLSQQMPLLTASAKVLPALPSFRRYMEHLLRFICMIIPLIFCPPLYCLSLPFCAKASNPRYRA